ncbi:hypothetical protein SE954_04895, partial [Pseudomonas aeruginosa]|nr:hypothetical protein [Pseudomonas aeruginosa]
PLRRGAALLIAAPNTRQRETVSSRPIVSGSGIAAVIFSRFNAPGGKRSAQRRRREGVRD